MKFKISRTRLWDDEVKPCDDAIKEPYIYVDTRAADDPVKIPVYNGNRERAERDWLSKGTNHRVENGCIRRDLDAEGWFIEINSLNELIQFQQKLNENLIISKSHDNDSMYEIEIYDGYRE